MAITRDASIVLSCDRHMRIWDAVRVAAGCAPFRKSRPLLVGINQRKNFMEVITKAAASEKMPVVPTETVDVPELGGAVTVRGMMLNQRLSYSAWSVKVREPAKDETPEAAQERTGSMTIAKLLSLCVVDAAAQGLYTQDQWEQFGAVHPAPCLRLFDIAWRCSGFEEADAAKN
jgi:hypothetical protein